MLNNFEKQTSVPKVYAFLGLVGIYFFLVFFNIAGAFLFQDIIPLMRFLVRARSMILK